MMEVSRTYGNLMVLSNRLSDKIKKFGIDSVPGPALGGIVDYPSLARRAGLGEYGRHGLLISEYSGSCQRIGAVFTNLRLPMEHDNSHGWVREFCNGCGKCIRGCPVGAIREEAVAVRGGHFSCVVHDRCLPYFSKNYGCSICIKECPFTTLGYNRIKTAFFRSKK